MVRHLGHRDARSQAYDARRRAHPRRDLQTTRSVEIHASAGTVWAWLVQIGQDRAGFYSYRALENLVLAEMPKVERIVMEWQLRERGEVVWLASPDHWGANGKQYIAAIEPKRYFIMTGEADWRSIQAGGSAKGTWGFIIEPLGEKRCRLIARSRYTSPPPGFELAHFIMERKMLLRIKQLAERPPSATDEPKADLPCDAGCVSSVTSRL